MVGIGLHALLLGLLGGTSLANQEAGLNGIRHKAAIINVVGPSRSVLATQTSSVSLGSQVEVFHLLPDNFKWWRLNLDSSISKAEALPPSHIPSPGGSWSDPAWLVLQYGMQCKSYCQKREFVQVTEELPQGGEGQVSVKSPFCLQSLPPKPLLQILWTFWIFLEGGGQSATVAKAPAFKLTELPVSPQLLSQFVSVVASFLSKAKSEWWFQTASKSILQMAADHYFFLRPWHSFLYCVFFFPVLKGQYFFFPPQYPAHPIQLVIWRHVHLLLRR